MKSLSRCLKSYFINFIYVKSLAKFNANAIFGLELWKKFAFEKQLLLVKPLLVVSQGENL